MHVSIISLFKISPFLKATLFVRPTMIRNIIIGKSRCSIKYFILLLFIFSWVSFYVVHYYLNALRKTKNSWQSYGPRQNVWIGSSVILVSDETALWKKKEWCGQCVQQPLVPDSTMRHDCGLRFFLLSASFGFGF